MNSNNYWTIDIDAIYS